MIKPLTSLRFVFAFMVFLLHICNSALAARFDQPTQWLATTIFREGYIGVGFFFMLSGFILAYSYKEKFIHKKVSKKKFWIARFARIYPLHLLTLLASIPLVQLIWQNNLEGMETHFLLNFYLLHSHVLPPGINWFWSFNTVSWSLSDEALFYFLFPFIVIFLHWNKKVFLSVVLLLCGIVPLLMFNQIPTVRSEWFYINPLARTVDFLIGMLLYEIYIKLKGSKILKYATLLEISAVVCFILFFMWHSSVENVYRFSCYYWIPIASIILIFSFEKGHISAFFSNKYFVYLGEISFGFYMFHALIIEYSLRLINHYAIFENYYFFIFFLFSSSILISILSYHLFERPISNFIIRTFS